jgi:hypothetical protein
MIAIAGADRRTLIDMIKKRDWWAKSFMNKYYSFYSDQFSLLPGVPEIILYPFDLRRPTFTHEPTPGSLGREENAYIAYQISKLDSEFGSASASDSFIKYIQKLCSPDGFVMEDGKTLRAQIDKTTGFFVDPRVYSGDPANLLPSEELRHMGDSFPELRFTRATLSAPAPTGAARRRTFRRSRRD